MDIFTHILMGTLPCFLLLGKISPEAIIFLWIMAIFPDLDIFIEPYSRKRNLYFLSHKAASHSYIIGIIITGIFSVFISLIRGTQFVEIWIAGAIGFSIHVSLDCFGASKVPIFYPLSKKEFRVIADRAINPILALFSGLSLLTLLIYYIISPYYHVFMTLTSIFLNSYFIYFGIRLILRIAIQMLLPKGSYYIPGFIPFFYLIYSNNSLKESVNYKLDRKFTFSLNKESVLNQTFEKFSDKMDYITQAIEISPEYRFFHKWNSMIPFIRENEQRVNVVLVLAESYSKMRSYFLSIIIDKESKKVISKDDGFGSFQIWRNQEF
ncbi:MAG: metal-dependent hydrolase [Candidatus Thorarchaeota archaeon]